MGEFSPISALIAMMTAKRVSLFVSLFVQLWLIGCAARPTTPTPATTGDGLKELVSVYEYRDYSKLPPPRKVEELLEYVDSLPNALSRIQSGEYEVVWGVGMSKSAPSSGGVLAYEKKAATGEGAVLLRDGTVKQMTAEEFAAARQIK
jgi:hypothetical protein